MDTVTISKQEYDELLSYKQAFIESEQIKRKSGKAYTKYVELQKMDAFFSKIYKPTYDQMKRVYQNEGHTLSS